MTVEFRSTRPFVVRSIYFALQCAGHLQPNLLTSPHQDADLFGVVSLCLTHNSSTEHNNSITIQSVLNKSIGTSQGPSAVMD